MPKFPKLSNNIQNLSNFFAPPISSSQVSSYKFNLGDTYLKLPEVASKICIKEENTYGKIGGNPLLRKYSAERCNKKYGYNISDESLFITAGCLGALNISCSSLLDKDDEVIAITPCWPNFKGVANVRGIKYKEVPVDEQKAVPVNPMDFEKRLKEAVTEKSSAIYFCDPDNPGGFLFPESYINIIEKVAEDYNLWIIHDIAYADLIFAEEKMNHLLARNNMNSHTFVTATYSKTFSMAGHRVGFLIVPEGLSKEVLKVLTVIEFHPSNIAQLIALECIKYEDQVIEKAVNVYKEGANIVINNLNADFYNPVAAAYAFVELSSKNECDETKKTKFYEECINNNLFIAPGTAFGKDYYNYFRLCYTSEPPEKLIDGIQVLNKILKNY